MQYEKDDRTDEGLKIEEYLTEVDTESADSMKNTQYFRKFYFEDPQEQEPEQEPVSVGVPLDDTFDDNAMIYRGNLRSGQDISSEKSIVVMGDVKPGANVTSYGSIYILGELRGNAFAGAGGDRDAIIMALDLRPIQVRIADAIAISPDAEKGAKLKVKKKKFLSGNEGDPEVAYIENGHIVKTGYGASFLREFYKI